MAWRARGSLPKVPTACPVCRLSYENFRTGLSFHEVQQSLFVTTEDRTRWRNKRRNGVLGAWHEIKRSEWQQHIRCCEEFGYDTVPF